MPEGQIQGKSHTAVAKDIAEGYNTLNPILLKKFDQEAFKNLHQVLKKLQKGIRSEKFPIHDVEGIRKRNMKLQRLHQALMVLEYSAKEKKILLY
ncbi:MAG: hypothetical protein L0Y56_19080 [Nitrospira sp.]|nr:hypothetical protein [Nitrospira sp.]